jgi:hypothetical protein
MVEMEQVKEKLQSLIQNGSKDDTSLDALGENFTVNYEQEDYDIIHKPTMALFVCQIWYDHGQIEEVHQLVEISEDTFIQEGGDQQIHLTFDSEGYWN